LCSPDFLARDLLRWRRVGLVRFAPLQGVDLGAQDNKSERANTRSRLNQS
jgi:hypothetical protein